LVRQGTIKLTKDCKVKAKKDSTEFDLEIPGRTYNFKSMEYPASEWIETLNKEIQRLDGKGMSFENV
jgi:hypothetical protein